MQNQTQQSSPALVLTFGATDPVGAIGIQADLAAFSTIGCLGVSVITGILIGDTTGVEDMQVVEADWVADQARVLLEDMPVAAFKVGIIGSVENAAVIAEVVSDYPDVPLVLDPFATGLPDPESQDEELLLALRELLIPQTALLILSTGELTRLSETWRDTSAQQTTDIDVIHLIRLGCEYVLVTGTPANAGQVANTLYDESGVLRRDVWPRLPGSFNGAGATLAATAAALLGNGLDVPQAVAEAQEFTNGALANAHRLGMGKLMPDRHFWMRENQSSDVIDHIDDSASN